MIRTRSLRKLLLTLAAFLAVYSVICWRKNTKATAAKLPAAAFGEHGSQVIPQIQESFKLPTQYEFYSDGGIKSGLVTASQGFLLNGKPFKIISGAVHYFRIHPAYWRDRLRKLRAAGLTAVETYVPWNLHEPLRGKFDFGDARGDWSPFLALVSYLKIAQEEDLFVIFRPGPYICSEWDFGGLPSWLLRDPTMHVRTSYAPYVAAVDEYFEKLISQIVDLQFSENGGPIIAVQVENEYGAFGYEDFPRDHRYLQHLSDKMRSLGLKELFLTSDSPVTTLDWGAVSGALQTANLQSNVAREFSALKQLQPDKPLMVTEFWVGWFDHWSEHHHTLSVEGFNETLKTILDFGASVNFYMFHGGTNFGFMNGANVLNEFPYYLPDVTSYDYDGLLTESGDYTLKYQAAKRLLKRYLPVRTRLPNPPSESLKSAYGQVEVNLYLSFEDLIGQLPQEKKVSSQQLLPMEELPINDMNGQSYGFTVYRKSVNLRSRSSLTIRGHVRDFAYVLVNGKLQNDPITKGEELRNFGSWVGRDRSLSLTSDGNSAPATLDIVVENLGRVNYGKPHNFIQKKGLSEGPVLLDGRPLQDWTIMALEFEGPWVRGLKNWKSVADGAMKGPLVLMTNLNIGGTPRDTFLDMSDWGKGVVFLNGFNLGRYWSMGPQQALYIPAPLLRSGENTVVIFELYAAQSTITFSDKPRLGD